MVPAVVYEVLIPPTRVPVFQPFVVVTRVSGVYLVGQVRFLDDDARIPGGCREIKQGMKHGREFT